MKKILFQEEMKKRLTAQITPTPNNEMNKTSPLTRPSVPLTPGKGSIFSFKKHLKLNFEKDGSFSLPGSPTEEEEKINELIMKERKNSKSLPQSPTSELEFKKEIETLILSSKNLLSLVESIDEIQKSPRIEIEELEIFSKEKELEVFKRFVREKLMMEQFDFYQLFHKYTKEEDSKVKTKLATELYEKYINPKSESSFTFSNHVLKKITKYYNSENPRGFQIVYREIFEQLSTLFQSYTKVEYEIKQQKKNSMASIPMNFQELIDSVEAFKLFSNFVSENFGANYIQCFHELLEFKKNKKEELIPNIIDSYCKKDSQKICLFNPKTRSNIIDVKGKIQLDWFDTLYYHIYDILSYEYFTRFINSNIWRNYIKLNFKKEKDLKFDDLYKINQIEKQTSSLSEKVEILKVSNKLTSELFRAKRIISSKSHITKISSNVRFQRLMMF
jgi:hypothetical protein